jgi:histidinol-phosphate aminotransferase
MYGPAHVIDAINRIRGRSTSTRRRSRPASPRSRTPRIRNARASTTRKWLAWLTEEIGKLGLK